MKEMENFVKYLSNKLSLRLLLFIIIIPIVDLLNPTLKRCIESLVQLAILRLSRKEGRWWQRVESEPWLGWLGPVPGRMSGRSHGSPLLLLTLLPSLAVPEFKFPDTGAQATNRRSYDDQDLPGDVTMKTKITVRDSKQLRGWYKKAQLN